MKALDLAHFVNNKAAEMDIPLENQKLQILLFYIQGYYFKTYQDRAIDEDFEFRQGGPVIPSVYEEFRETTLVFLDQTYSVPKPLQITVNSILEETKNFSAQELVEKINKDGPGLSHENHDEIIPVERIRIYFKENDPLRISNKNIKISKEEFIRIVGELIEERHNLYKELSKL